MEQYQEQLTELRSKLVTMKEKKLAKVRKNKDGTETAETEGVQVDTKALISEIKSWNEQQKGQFSVEVAQGKRNIEICFDKPWSDEDLTRFRAADRVDLNMPGIFPKVLSLLGFEKNNRQQFEAEPVGEEDELTAQLFNLTFRHIENNNDPKKYEYTKTDVFVDGIIPFFGCSEIYIEKNSSGDSEIKLRHLPYNEVLFDRNFTEYEMEGCSRVQHFYDTYLEDLIAEDPERKEELEEIKSDGPANDNSPLIQKTSDYSEVEGMNKGKRPVRVIRDWKKIITWVYELHCINEDKVYEFFKKAEAEAQKQTLIEEKKAALGGLIQQLEMSNISIDPTGFITNQQYFEDESAMIEQDYIIKAVMKEEWQYTKTAGNKILEGPEILEVDECPLTFYFALFFQGKIIPVISIVRDLQQYWSKLFAQMDYMIGTDTKNTKYIYANKIDTEFQTVEDAIKSVAEGDTVIVMQGEPGQGSPIGVVQRTGIHSEYWQLFEILMKLMEDSFGGRNFQGAQETAGQSGKAIQRLQMAAAVMTLNYMDNLRRYDEQVGKKLVKFVKKYYTHKYSVKVWGEEMSNKILKAMEANGLYKESLYQEGYGWAVVNDPENPNRDKIRPLSDASINITINKVSARQDELDIEYEKLIGLKSQGYAVPVKAILKTLKLSATTKQEIIEENDKQQKMQEAMAAANMKLQELQANQSVAGQFKPKEEKQDNGIGNQ